VVLGGAAVEEELDSTNGRACVRTKYAAVFLRDRGVGVKLGLGSTLVAQGQYGMDPFMLAVRLGH
jgi:hypothetical protein